MDSEVVRPDWNIPLTWLATLVSLSPRDGAVNPASFQPSPEGSGPGEESLRGETAPALFYFQFNELAQEQNHPRVIRSMNRRGWFLL